MVRFSRVASAIVGVALLSAPAGAQTQTQKKPPSQTGAPGQQRQPGQPGAQGQPQMTQEQRAEMEAYQKAGTPGPQHQALAATAGDYDIKMKSWHDATGAPMEEAGTVRRSMALDGRVLVEELNGTMMGQPYTGHGMMGYDNVTGKYWSTWNDSMSTALMVTEGTCDAQGKNCTFTGTYNDPVKKTPIRTRMTTRWPSPTTEIFEMYGPAPDGKEMKMMEITYTKK
ncbi:MAG TPA: DUF1579 domain-containing protein [Candidatus Polarisedimenticolia bacterium]|nr:DUF1579 domain-containing protein [Candidatus Polarisedimenticolia bacterium]